MSSAGGAGAWKLSIVELSNENVEKLCSTLRQMIVDEVDNKRNLGQNPKKGDRLSNGKL